MNLHLPNRKTLLGVFLVLALPACGQSSKQPEIILVGTIHNWHFNVDNHYSLADLRAEIEALHPEVICGEITPDAFEGPMEGYFPPEAAMLAELAPTLNARFVPADWRMAKAWQTRAEGMIPCEQAKRIEAMQAQQAALIQGYRGPSLFDLMSSQAMFDLNDRLFEEAIGENNAADIAYGCWHERNRRIVENSLDAVPGARRIVIVFGDAHLPQLRRQLAKLGLTARLATRTFTPAGLGTVPPSVLSRWRKNLDALKGILDGRIKVSRDALALVRPSSRVQDLERALAAYTPH